MEVARQEREDLEKINEELHRMIFQMQEADRKKQQTIKQYQEQNKNMVLSKQHQPRDDSVDMPSSDPVIEKLNASFSSQPTTYKDYNHSSNPNNPFDDDDSTGSDWDNVDPDEVSSDDQFEVVASNKRQLNQSLAAIEKKFHLDQGLEALALGEEEIERLKRTHYDKQATWDKLKALERSLEERDQRARASRDANLPMVVEEEPEGSPGDLDEEESLLNESSSWDIDHDDIESPEKSKNLKKADRGDLDRFISPELIAASSCLSTDQDISEGMNGTVLSKVFVI